MINPLNASSLVKVSVTATKAAGINDQLEKLKTQASNCPTTYCRNRIQRQITTLQNQLHMLQAGVPQPAGEQPVANSGIPTWVLGLGVLAAAGGAAWWWTQRN